VFIDLFNGDADGILSRHILRLTQPREVRRVTGVKRDVELLAKVTEVEGAELTVLDVALSANAEALPGVLEKGNRITWFDHHNPGPIPDHPKLETHIDTSPELCTALIVNRYLGSPQPLWACAAAFGDNLLEVAGKEAQTLGLGVDETEVLKGLGETLNYNGYGLCLADLTVDPHVVSEDLEGQPNPFDYVKRSAIFQKIARQREADAAAMRSSEVLHAGAEGNCVLLPDSPASTRMSGLYSNELVFSEPDKAHAIFTHDAKGGYRISIRAPLSNPRGADELALRFEGGGGRPKAGGVNHLPKDELSRFIREFTDVFQSRV